jgi:hypothetical protein
MITESGEMYGVYVTMTSRTLVTVRKETGHKSAQKCMSCHVLLQKDRIMATSNGNMIKPNHLKMTLADKKYADTHGSNRTVCFSQSSTISSA